MVRLSAFRLPSWGGFWQRRGGGLRKTRAQRRRENEFVFCAYRRCPRRGHSRGGTNRAVDAVIPAEGDAALRLPRRNRRRRERRERSRISPRGASGSVPAGCVRMRLQ